MCFFKGRKLFMDSKNTACHSDLKSDPTHFRQCRFVLHGMVCTVQSACVFRANPSLRSPGSVGTRYSESFTSDFKVTFRQCMFRNLTLPNFSWPPHWAMWPWWDNDPQFKKCRSKMGCKMILIDCFLYSRCCVWTLSY